jgi:hypothetical protein
MAARIDQELKVSGMIFLDIIAAVAIGPVSSQPIDETLQGKTFHQYSMII